MRKIVKYPIPLREEFDIEMPYRAQCLSVQVEMGIPGQDLHQASLWVLADPEQEKLPVRFRLLQQNELSDDTTGGYSFVSGFRILCDRLMEGPPVVFHLFVEHPACTWNRAKLPKGVDS